MADENNDIPASKVVGRIARNATLGTLEVMAMPLVGFLPDKQRMRIYNENYSKSYASSFTSMLLESSAFVETAYTNNAYAASVLGMDLLVRACRIFFDNCDNPKAVPGSPVVDIAERIGESTYHGLKKIKSGLEGFYSKARDQIKSERKN